jgi:hypothetical protein
MSDYKAFFKQKMERMKSTAAQFIPLQDDERVVALQAETYERALEWAEEHQTTVEAIVNETVERFLADNRAVKAPPISPERQELNPLLLLDGLCGREL